MPEVSVLLPAFNAGTTLVRALASVRRQTGVQWECVVVDDGSTDDTVEIVERAHARDGRFRLVRCAHGGIVSALNQGLGACAAPLVARMDADDIMLPERLSRQTSALEREALDAVGAHVRLFPRAGLREGRLAYEAWLNSLTSRADIERDLFVECPIAHPTLMVRTAVLRDHRYRDVPWAEDYDLVLRLLAAGRSVGIVPSVLHKWRDHPTRLSRVDARYGLDQFFACKAAFLSDGFLADRREYVLWGYGDTGRELCRALKQHGKVPRYIVELHPGRLGQTIAGAQVIPPDALPAHVSPAPAAPSSPVTQAVRAHLPIVVSVAGAGPREEIRKALAQMGYREVRDYRVAA